MSAKKVYVKIDWSRFTFLKVEKGLLLFWDDDEARRVTYELPAWQAKEMAKELLKGIRERSKSLAGQWNENQGFIKSIHEESKVE